MTMKKGIIINPKIMHGEPVIAGTRIQVYLILDLIASGYTIKEIIRRAYPHLTERQIKDAINYASELFQDEKVVEVLAKK